MWVIYFKTSPKGKIDKFTLIGGPNSICCEVQAKRDAVKIIEKDLGRQHGF